MMGATKQTNKHPRCVHRPGDIRALVQGWGILGGLVRVPQDRIRHSTRRHRACHFSKFTGRTTPLAEGYLEATLIIGRRGGKDSDPCLHRGFSRRILRLVALSDWRRARYHHDRCGRSQTGTGNFPLSEGDVVDPGLAGLIERETAESIDLNNNITVEILSANFKTVQ